MHTKKTKKKDNNKRWVIRIVKDTKRDEDKQRNLCQYLVVQFFFKFLKVMMNHIQSNEMISIKQIKATFTPLTMNKFQCNIIRLKLLLFCFLIGGKMFCFAVIL